jgi:hypothetical protein
VDFLRFKHIKQASNTTHPHEVPVAERWHDLRHAVKLFYFQDSSILTLCGIEAVRAHGFSTGRKEATTP